VDGAGEGGETGRRLVIGVHQGGLLGFFHGHGGIGTVAGTGAGEATRWRL
jgi:hypothetical protein